ncbi:MAG: Bax inhibitor-1/YccA family protein [Marmoricola sp.]
MESRNPVFSRVDGFNGRGTASGNATYPGYGQQQAGYGDPSQWGTGAPGGGHDVQVDQGRMTLDSVVQKTAVTLGVVVLAAVATWFLTGDMDTMTQAQLNGLYGISLVGAIGGFALGMVNSFKKIVSPGLVLVYAVLQGVFVGAFSKALEVAFTQPGQEPGGLVIGAVVGTMAAVAGTLAAYKFFNIQVGTRFRKWVVAAGMGFLAVTLFDLVLGFFGAEIGFNGFGPLGLLMSVVGLGLGVLFLILDFDFVERGIAAGLPERESWRAAFGLTATIVFIYIEILRILAILRGD